MSYLKRIFCCLTVFIFVFSFGFVVYANPLDDLLSLFGVRTTDSNVNVRTKADMIDFALICLKERYQSSFEIEEENLTYGHKDGKKNNPFVLRAYAHPIDDVNKRFFVIVTESGECKDNYWTYMYEDEVKELVSKDMFVYDLQCDVKIDYPVTEKPYLSLTAEELMMDKRCIIFFEPVVEDCSDVKEYVLMIRKWMDFLYALDYNWYLKMYRASDDNVVFTLDPHDNGFHASDDWTDELIASYFEN